MNYICVPNSLWQLELSPNAFKVYCGIASFRNHRLGYACVSMRKLSNRICMSERSVLRGVVELEEKGLLQVTTRSFQGNRIANLYKLAITKGRFTVLPLEALQFPINAHAFKVYVFTCLNVQTRLKKPSQALHKYQKLPRLPLLQLSNILMHLWNKVLFARRIILK